MGTEIEAKLKVASLDEVEEKLASLGARFLAEQRQSDSHFDDAGGSLRKGDRCLRLRHEVVGSDERYILTYKGPKQESRLKARREIEVEVKDADSTRELFSELGYAEVFVLEKRRRLWQLGDCAVAVDELPLLGGFVEIEGPDETKIEAAQSDLGLGALRHIPISYASLMTAELRRRNENEREPD